MASQGLRQSFLLFAGRVSDASISGLRYGSIRRYGIATVPAHFNDRLRSTWADQLSLAAIWQTGCPSVTGPQIPIISSASDPQRSSINVLRRAGLFCPFSMLELQSANERPTEKPVKKGCNLSPFLADPATLGRLNADFGQQFFSLDVRG